MPDFTANIAFLFADRPFLERIDAARAAGFDKVECHFPYDVPVATLKERLDAAGVRMTGLNTAPGDIRAGDWGLAALIGREDEFERGFRQAADYATALGAGMIHVMAGVVTGPERKQACRTYIRNIRRAARSVAADGLTLLLEPLNKRDRPNYLVSRSDHIANLIEEIGEPNVKLLFDAYHVQIMEGDLIRRIERHAPIIGHVQIAGVPDRAEPDGGEVHYPSIFDCLAANGYRGLIGLEYKPRGSTEEGLAWMGRLGMR